MKLNRLFAAYKSSEISLICKELTGYDLNEKGLKYSDISEHWRFVGDNPSNGSVIGMLRKGEKGLIERVTNGVDAVIEKKVAELFGTAPSSSNTVIAKAFPKYYECRQKIKKGEEGARSNAYDAANQVLVAVSDGSRSSRPTFDVVDHGTGISGKDFPNTILSLNKGNKLSSDKQYLIGAFGQGGSTSLSFANATVIVSKIEDKFWFTIVRAVDLEDYKNIAYVYLTVDGEIPTAELDGYSPKEEWIAKFIGFDSGTFVRMVEMNISQDISSLDAAKPRGLVDFINTELFDIGLPISVYENRKSFALNEHHQNRVAYGSSLRLSTWSYVKEEYSGSLVVDYENRPYRIDYYAVLPNKEEDWASDAKCRETFGIINVYDDPIIYTVNGQTVCTETFTKLKNGGLSQLKHRLLIVINLDLLGKEKYKFFTTDRSQIRVTDSSKGLLQEIVSRICKEEKLIELNSYIASLALSNGLNEDDIAEIAQEVKSQYSQYMKNGGMVKFTHPSGEPKPSNPVDYADHIVELTLVSPSDKFYMDEEVSFLVKTGAEKYVNQRAKIDVFLDDKSNDSFVPTNSRGVVRFKATAKEIKEGRHSISFACYRSNGDSIESETHSFEIIGERVPDLNQSTKYSKVPNIEIQCNPNAELIMDIARIESENKILVTYNNIHEMLYAQVYGKQAKESDLKDVTDHYLKPTILFVLFMGERFENLETEEEKNQLVVNFIKAQLTTFNEA